MNKGSNNFLKSVSLLSTGSIIAQLVTIFASPITSRIFSPEEMGIYTLLVTVVGMFNASICGKYDLSIVTENEEDNIFALIKLSFIISIFLSTLVSIGFFIYLFVNKQYQAYYSSAFIVFFLLIISGLVNVLTAYNNRLREYKIIANVYVVRTVLLNLLMIILGWLKSGVWGLLISQMISNLAGIKQQFKSFQKNWNKLKYVDTKRMLKSGYKHKKQLIYATPAGFINNFTYSSINIFIESLYGAHVLGLYSLSYRILGLPLAVISTNVSRVFFEEASREFEKTQGFRISLNKIMKYLVLIGLVMWLGLTFIVPDLVTIVFGENWSDAGRYIQLLAPMFTIRFVVSAISSGLIVAQQQKYDLITQLMFIVFSIGILTLSNNKRFAVETYLALISFGYSIVYLIYFAVVYYNSKARKNK